MTENDDNVIPHRPDEKRSRFFPLLIILVGISFVIIGFIGQAKPIIKNFYREYRFNQAVVTNNIDGEESPSLPVPPEEKKNKSKPAKPEKKSADYCPT